MIKLSEADDISAVPAPVTVEKVMVRIDQEAGIVILVQGAQSHPAAAGEGPLRAPILRFQIRHERDLPFQFVESLASHGLLASMGRIRQSAARSQARMVGERKKHSAVTPTFTQQATVSRRRRAQRRSVAGSGERDGL